VVIAYDDREISLDGKKVVSDTGGTWRATHRMIGAIRGEFELEHSLRGDFDLYRGMNEQVQLLLHRNPQNTILHTVLVGEMNGLLHALTVGTALEEAWGVFGGPRAYTRWISAHGPGSIHAGSYGPRSGSASVIKTAAEHESAPGPGTGPAGCRSEGGGAVEGIPARAQDAPGGRALMREVAQLPLEQREQVLFEQIVAGNVPVFLREFKTIRVRNDLGEAEIRVSPDYFAVGSDNDFVRVPLTPMAAQRIADRFGWSLPTRKIVDDVYREAQVKLEPQPMTENREAVETFVEHNDIIEAQRREQPLGLLIAGIKKDVVISNRLNEKPQRVAIYGWHQPGGKPIQPLTTVHRETYVDYSHGIRFVEGVVRVDGRAMQLDEVLRDEKLSPLLSDEGPITPTRYEAPPTARPAER